jgi:hypothetical protein
MNETAQMPTSNIDTTALKSMIDAIMKDPAAAKEKIARECERLKELSKKDAKVAIGLLNG